MPQIADFQSNRDHHDQLKTNQHGHDSAAVEKTHHTSYNTDYSEKSANKNKEQDKKNSKGKSQSPKKPTPKKASSVATDVDEDAIPDPAPNSGATQTSVTVHHTGGIYSGVLPVIPPSSTRGLSSSGFSPLPLAAFATSLSAVAVSSAPPSSLSPAPSTTARQKDQRTNHVQGSNRLPTVSIVLLVVGAVILLAGLIVVFRFCSRPRKPKYPTPSRPILQDPFQDEEKGDPDEESLFGGKERSSTRPGSGEVLLNWTQYPHTSLMKPLPPLDVYGSVPGSPPKRRSPEMVQKHCSPFLGLPATPGSNLGTRTPGRLSAVSASVYPGSPASTMGGHGVGIAVGGSPLTADNLPLLQRSNTKSSIRKAPQPRGTRHSVIPSTYGTSDLYGGVASPVPTTPQVAATANGATGRARVKAPYTPGSFLRASATAPIQTTSFCGDPNPFEESQYVLPPISPMTKTEDRRERDTKALTSALGLASPGLTPPSPPSTLYPDDSITLAGDRRRSRTRSQIMSPTLDAGARLGKLMMGDFQSMASLPSTKNVADGPSSGLSKAKNISRKRVDEKPPRVPSPPPIPSLAQMALAHGNPQAFEDYRSPTYSIYGLYEADRKSKTPGGGGY